MTTLTKETIDNMIVHVINSLFFDSVCCCSILLDSCVFLYCFIHVLFHRETNTMSTIVTVLSSQDLSSGYNYNVSKLLNL